jgi:hypothetical protein
VKACTTVRTRLECQFFQHNPSLTVHTNNVIHGDLTGVSWSLLNHFVDSDINIVTSSRMCLFMAMAQLASLTSVCPLYTLKSQVSLRLPGPLLSTETFGGWLQSYLESQMMDCQYDQANAAMSIHLAVSCYRYISDKFTLFTDIVSFRS